MALKDTIEEMDILLEDLAVDLKKAERGNKTAAQRVRTGTVQLEKIAKLYRKESMIAEGGGRKKRRAGKKKKTVRKKAAARKKRR